MVIIKLFVFGLLACPNDLISMLEDDDPTDRFINYLQSLQKESGIDIDLSILTSKKGILLNPIDQSLIYSNPIMAIHYESIESFLKESLDFERIHSFVTDNTNNLERFKSDKNATIDQTKDATLIPFKKITIGDTTFAVSPFITQDAWIDLMYQAYPLDTTFDDRFEPFSSELLDVRWLSAFDFANQLSIKEGLIPLYDLNAIYAEGIDLKDYNRNGYLELDVTVENEEDAPEKWELKLKEKMKTISKLFKQIFPKSNKKYNERDGYRLPTEEELRLFNNLWTDSDGNEWSANFFDLDNLADDIMYNGSETFIDIIGCDTDVNTRPFRLVRSVKNTTKK